jgi:4-carboxymuconolactone decarboxylase
MTTDPNRALGGRLPLFDPAHLTDAQKTLFDTLQASWIKFADAKGVRATTDDGRLIGPFNPFLLHPEITAKLSDLQVAEAAHTTLSPRVREVVVIMTGAVWRADYELYAQLNVARGTGLSDATVAALASGAIPEDLGDDETIAARVALDLLTRHRIDDDLYRAAKQAFGPTGLYDITAVMGVYQTVCSMLALFEVPAPD